MYCVRHILKGCLPALLTLSMGAAPVHTASAETPNLEVADPYQALDFVDGLAAKAYEALSEKLSDTEREQRFQTLLERGFNTRYIALFVLGRYGQTIGAPALARYESTFDDFLLHKYVALIEAYGVARFHTVGAERAGRRDVLVHMIVNRSGDSLDTEWRVRIFDGEMRIIDVSIAGFSLVQTERAEFADMIKQTDFEGFLDSL